VAGASERIEIARLMPCMLGCTEYGSLSAKQMEIGYYDRIEDTYHPTEKSQPTFDLDSWQLDHFKDLRSI
jgi:hypothetical protein